MMRLRTFLHRLRRDEKGVSAVEFAFIAPVLILLYFGVAEYSQALMAERRAIRTASAIGDLVAQANGEISPTGSGGIDDVFDISSELMKPFPVSSSNIKLCVASVVANAAGTQNKVEWSRNQNDSTCPAKNALVNGISANLLGAGESVIMSRVIYTYTGSVNKVITTNPTFTKTFYLRPRRSLKIACSSC